MAKKHHKPNVQYKPSHPGGTLNQLLESHTLKVAGFLENRSRMSAEVSRGLEEMRRR